MAQGRSAGQVSVELIPFFDAKKWQDAAARAAGAAGSARARVDDAAARAGSAADRVAGEAARAAGAAASVAEPLVSSGNPRVRSTGKAGLPPLVMRDIEEARLMGGRSAVVRMMNERRGSYSLSPSQEIAFDRRLMSEMGQLDRESIAAERRLVNAKKKEASAAEKRAARTEREAVMVSRAGFDERVALEASPNRRLSMLQEAFAAETDPRRRAELARRMDSLGRFTGGNTNVMSTGMLMTLMFGFGMDVAGAFNARNQSLIGQALAPDAVGRMQAQLQGIQGMRGGIFGGLLSLGWDALGATTGLISPAEIEEKLQVAIAQRTLDAEIGRSSNTRLANSRIRAASTPSPFADLNAAAERVRGRQFISNRELTRQMGEARERIAAPPDLKFWRGRSLWFTQASDPETDASRAGREMARLRLRELQLQKKELDEQTQFELRQIQMERQARLGTLAADTQFLNTMAGGGDARAAERQRLVAGHLITRQQMGIPANATGGSARRRRQYTVDQIRIMQHQQAELAAFDAANRRINTANFFQHQSVMAGFRAMGSGDAFGGQRDQFFAQMMGAIATETDPQRRMQLMMQLPAGMIAMTAARRRQGSQASAQARAMMLGAQGFDLQASLASIDAQFMPRRDAAGNITSLNGMTAADPAFAGQLALFGAARVQARLTHRQRQMREQGQMRVMAAQFFGGDFAAAMAGVDAELAASNEGVTNPLRRLTNITGAFMQKALISQQKAERDQLVRMGLIGEERQLRALLDRDPASAEFIGISEAGRMRAQQLANQKDPESVAAARKTIQNTMLALEVSRNDYLLGFKALNTDLRAFDTTNVRDVDDPSRVLANLAQEVKTLTEKLSEYVTAN